jgi:hypothetical protein
MSRKNGASHKHHKIKQLQQIETAISHQGKTKTVNISRFTFITFFTVFWATWFNASCLENFKDGFWIFSQHLKMKGTTHEEFCLTHQVRVALSWLAVLGPDANAAQINLPEAEPQRR